MKIRLLAFATAADAIGAPRLDLELPEGSTVADLRRLLAERHPRLAEYDERLAVAVAGELAGPDTPLEEGAEVALLPPVSGGAPDGDAAAPDRPTARLTDGPIDAAELTAAVSAADRGAVVLFLGTVRDHHAGRRVDGITYHAYRPMAERALERLAAELAAAGEGLAVGIVHRIGEIAVGEASVAIAAASPHRAAAYAASREALERLKREVPIWKRERYADGEERWREEEPLVGGGASQPASGPARSRPASSSQAR